LVDNRFDNGACFGYNKAMNETDRDQNDEIGEDEIRDDEQQVQVVAYDPSPATNLMRLAFAKAYIECGGNGTEAAHRAGYSGSRASLARTANRLLRENDVQHYLTAHIRSQIDAREVVARLTSIARGSIGYFIVIDPRTGQPTGLDLSTPQAQENMHLIRKLKPTRFGYEIELYSQLEALDLIVRVLRLEDQQNEKKKVLAQAIEDMPENVREPFKQLLASFGTPEEVPGLATIGRAGKRPSLGEEQEIEMDEDGEDDEE
jgi:hypothetical protein